MVSPWLGQTLDFKMDKCYINRNHNGMSATCLYTVMRCGVMQRDLVIFKCGSTIKRGI